MLFAGLDESERHLLMSRMSRHTCATGELLIRADEVGDSMHLVERGKVAVRTAVGMRDVVTLAVRGPGATVGEPAMSPQPVRRCVDGVALEPVVTHVIHRVDFDALCRTHPAMERFLVAVLAARVNELSGQVVDALHLRADQRVAKRLVDLAELYGAERADGTIVDIPLRQEDLASMAGITRPTTNRVLQQLSSAGLISVGRARTTVLDLAALQLWLGRR
jgi:CRP/FNR family transcriptional regulator, cyclic AMP receptor protein